MVETDHATNGLARSSLKICGVNITFPISAPTPMFLLIFICFISLQVFPDAANELLPIFNKTSYHKYSQSIPVGDWSNTSQTTGLHGAVHRVGHIATTNHFHVTDRGSTQQRLLSTKSTNTIDQHKRQFSSVPSTPQYIVERTVPPSATVCSASGMLRDVSVSLSLGKVITIENSLLSYLFAPVLLSGDVQKLDMQ